MADIQLLRELCLAPGISGHEGPVMNLIKSQWPAGNPVEQDALGSLITTIGNTGPRLMVEAHADELGFIVASITQDGFLRLKQIGGWVPGSVQGTPVMVIPRKGDPVRGVVACIPSHYTKGKHEAPNVESMLVDVGALSEDEVTERGIALGDPIVVKSRFYHDSHADVCMGKAMDNRVGCALVVEACRHVAASSLNHTTIGAISVQEEVGARGITSLRNLSNPDAAIVLEGIPCDDYPGLTPEPQTALKKGAHVRLYDPGFITKPAFAHWVKDVANECDIPIQPTVRRVGGTDARELQYNGITVPTIVIGVPVRYAHSPTSTIAVCDYDACLQLLVALLDRFDDAVLQTLKSS